MSNKISSNISLGIFGGTFDPIHNGHIACALSAFETFNMDGIKFIPCAITPHKNQPERSPEQRCDMVRLALEGYESFELDDRECQREGKSYTIDTIQSIRAELGDKHSLIFILGTDSFESIESWKHYSQLLDYCHLLVVQRPDCELSTSDSLDALINKHQTNNTEELNTLPNGKIFFFEGPLVDISSSEIRKSFDFKSSLNPSKGIQKISLSLSFGVKEYIHQNALYQEKRDPY